MQNPLMRKRDASIVPYAFPPGEDAAKALSNVIAEFQVARRFERLTLGDLDGFVDRWADWFGAGVVGDLHMPGRFPES